MGRAKREGRWEPQKPRGPRKKRKTPAPQIGNAPLFVSEESARRLVGFGHIIKGIMTLMQPTIDSLLESAMHDQPRQAVHVPQFADRIKEELESCENPTAKKPNGVAICKHGVYHCPECMKEDKQEED